MKNVVKLILTFVFSAYGTTLLSADWKIFSSWNSDLPEANLTISLDSLGNKWITSNRGLIKVDNFNWTWYNIDNSKLPSNLLYRIEVDRFNRKWVCSDSGLVLFNDTSWVVFNKMNAGFKTNNIFKVFFDNQDNIWISSVGAGIYKYDWKQWHQIDTNLFGIRFRSLNTMKQEPNGDYWFATNDYLVNQRKDTVIVYGDKQIITPYSYILSIYFDPDGTKWFAGYGAINKFDEGNWSFYNANNIH